jgi:hypothetical protein
MRRVPLQVHLAIWRFGDLAICHAEQHIAKSRNHQIAKSIVRFRESNERV